MKKSILNTQKKGGGVTRIKKFLQSLLIVVLAVLPLISFLSCKSTDVGSSPYEIQQIIEVVNVNQEDLYVRVNSACVDLFRNAKSVIQFSDKSSGIIKGKFIIPKITYGMYYCSVDVTVTVETKDGRCRLTFADMSYTYVGDVLNGLYRKDGRTEILLEDSDMVKKVQPELEAFIKNFKSKVSSNASDW